MDLIKSSPVEYLQDQLDQNEIALRWTTNRGSWTYEAAYTGRLTPTVLHVPTGDLLATMVYAEDARHAVRWQPSRIAAEIKAKRQLIERYRSMMRLADTPVLATSQQDVIATTVARRIADELLIVITSFAEAAGWTAPELQSSPTYGPGEGAQ